MSVKLNLICGICWSIAYIVAIIRGFRHKTWCIPGFSISLNFAWELSAVLERIADGAVVNIPFLMQTTWLILDLVVIATWLIYDRRGKGQLCRNCTQMVLAFLAVYLLTHFAGQWVFSVFLINVLMSGEFILRIEKDHSPWISHTVAVAKLIGTLAAAVLNGMLHSNPMVIWLGGICLLLDSYYLFLLFHRKKE